MIHFSPCYHDGCNEYSEKFWVQNATLFYTENATKNLSNFTNCKFDINVLVKRFQDYNYFRRRTKPF